MQLSSLALLCLLCSTARADPTASWSKVKKEVRTRLFLVFVCDDPVRELPPQAVSHYLSQVSLPSLLLGALHPGLPGLLLGPQERTAELDSEADWVFAISKAAHCSIDILSKLSPD